MNKDKEKAVETARAELEAKRRKLEEDKAQQDPSDPESTASSLTISSGSAVCGGGKEGTGGHGNTSEDMKEAPASTKKVSEDSGSAAKKRSSPSAEVETSIKNENKKARLDSHESTSFSSSLTSSTEAEDKADRAKRVDKDVSTHGTSSVSDLTDSNKGSSISNGESEDTSRHNARRSHQKIGTDRAAGSACSDAAVDGEKEKHSMKKRHSDVLVRKRKHSSTREELTSMDPDFVLNYEEVFLKSNIPQLLASTAGRIIAWNGFFLEVTGLAEAEVEQSTIFSLVKTSKLANLFEIVAAALRKTKTGSGSSTDSPAPSDKSMKLEAKPNSLPSSSVGEVKQKAHTHAEQAEPQDESLKDVTGTMKEWDYAAMTLPCIKFRAKTPSPLYITVSSGRKRRLEVQLLQNEQLTHVVSI